MIGIETANRNPIRFFPRRNSAIPPLLRYSDRWVAWRYAPNRSNPARPKKIPVNPKTGDEADVTRPESWGSLSAARSMLRAKDLDGIGFVLGDGFAGIDLDGIADPQTGEIDPWGESILNRLNSYTEISPSRTGIKVFVLGELAVGLKHRYSESADVHIELYDGKRFFTVTGNVVEGFSASLEDRSSELLELHRALETADQIKRSSAPRSRRSRWDQSAIVAEDAEIIQRATTARNGAKFSRLWSGDWSGYRSRSEADFALAAILGFWCGPDVARIRGLMGQSSLNRPKWNRADYLPRTIQSALETVPLFYSQRIPQHCVLKSGTPLPLAWKLASEESIPEQATVFDNANVRTLAALCFHLQRLKGSDFGIDRRKAGELLGVSHNTANKYFHALIQQGFIQETKKGTYASRKLSVYRCPSAIGGKS